MFSCKPNENKQIQSNEITIAAASDLKFALDSVIEVYTANNPDVKITATYGSSGKFYEQIFSEAPFDIYFSADIKYPKMLEDNKLTFSDVKVYGIGRIVIWSKILDPNIDGINTFLNEKIIKIAIANPDHAPYGARAKEALEFYNIYDSISQNLVYGENISQTAQFVTSDAADAGIVALSLALSKNMKSENGFYYVLPTECHSPLEQA